jgi:hypothetical protein
MNLITMQALADEMNKIADVPLVLKRVGVGASLGGLGGLSYHALAESAPKVDMFAKAQALDNAANDPFYGRANAADVHEAMSDLAKRVGMNARHGGNVLVELEGADRDVAGRIAPVVVGGDARQVRDWLKNNPQPFGRQVTDESLHRAGVVIDQAAKPWWAR